MAKKSGFIGIFAGSEIPGYKIKKFFGDIVNGCEAKKLDMSDTRFKSIIKDRKLTSVKDYEASLTETLLRDAKLEMISRAVDMGANAVLNVRVVGKGGDKKSKIIVYGDPVILAKK